MLTDEIDEDIEALLYAQVYHAKSAEGNKSQIIVAREDISNANDKEECMDDNRQQENYGQPANLEPSPETTPTADPNLSLNNLQCSEISTSTTKTGSLEPTQIPVSPDDPISDQEHTNQNFCPGPKFFDRLQSFKTKTNWSDKCEQALINVQAGLINEKQFFRILRRVSLQKKKRRKQAQKTLSTVCSDIVYLSDSSDDSDIEIVSVKEKNMEEVTQISDSDEGGENDDIIYIEPPPVPVVTVADETDENEELPDEPPGVEEPSLHIDEEASNDFLPAATTSGENFNFSLHGSEFQDAEFVRPANPCDHYETESSTSTSDFNRESSREFSNTVKTIVFNEVDFPKDIFDDSNNLEKFGELITPKRKNKSANSEDDLEKAGTSGYRKRHNRRKSSESGSSSESDYDPSESHQHLPHLSPMVPVQSSPLKKRKNSVQNKDRPLEENQDIIAGEDTNADKKTKKKRKKKNTGDTTNEDLEKSDESDVHTTTSSLTKGATAPTIKTEKIAKKNELPKKNMKKKNKTGREEIIPQADRTRKEEIALRAHLRLFDEIEELRGETEQIVGDLMTRKGRTRWLLRSQKAGEENADIVPLRKKKKKKKKNKAVENLNDGVDQSNAEIDLIITEEEQNDMFGNDFDKGPMEGDQETTCTKVTEEECKKRKSDNNFERNDNKEAEKNKKTKRNSSSKQNSFADKEVNGVGQDEEKVEDNLITVDEDDDILIIEKPIPLHVIQSSESEDDIISFGDLGQELQLANIENERKNDDKLKDFDIENIKSRMSDDPLKWQVNTKDINKVKTPACGPRCRKCRQTGHIAMRCPNKQELPRCFLCGFEGHEEPRCKNKVCFTCGARGSFSTVYCYRCVNQRKLRCALCHLIGHSSEGCPDLWRRYHSTTKRGPVVVSKDNRLKPKNLRWCSGCAANGHLEFQCKSYRWLREYPVTSPIIFEWHDVYDSKNDESVGKAFDLRGILDSNRENTSDLRKKLDERRMKSSTNSIASTADTTQTDADNNTNAKSQTSQTSTETPKVSQPPSTESPLPPEGPQILQVCQTQNPILSAERSLNVSPNKPDININKSKKRRQNRDRRPNPVSFMNNRHAQYETRNWSNERYQSVLNPNLGMDNRPYPNQIQQFPNQPQQFPNQIQQFSNQFQQFSNQIQQFPNQIQQFPNQIQPFNQIQQLNLFNPIPAFYQPPRYYDFTRDNERWNDNNPQMFTRLTYEKPRPLLDIAFSPPNNRHLPVRNFSSRDFSNAPFTITREPSPRLLEFSGPHQSEMVMHFVEP
ncbi:unnamed protein product [Ceutorhynchus assimilis]|uniref:Zinc finger CCHC domain-containing protein 7 n=1 Tax=Ceutorhynchus assimilis TaxID=467358 RepID=A0A9P0DIJ0_9CUCU|nr:unnamed protein product [Ceutorhynchus assimilis]